MSRISICDIPVDVLTMQETVELINNAIENKSKIHHVVINAGKVVNAHKDKALKESIINCDIINADGQSIVWASRFLNRPLPKRVAGIDLMEEVLKLASRERYRIFLLGAKEEIVKSVAEICNVRYGRDIVCGYRNGYYQEEEEPIIAKEIAISNADILFVAMSSPKKEIFLHTYKDILQISFTMGVGGSFDVIAGLVKRAPQWMQDYGMEWFYRLIQEPRRMWKRYLFGNSAFIYLVLRQKIQQIFRNKK
jgi:N-acetylglucosaminyldiphosphoundecaprenol N-acetyl-beta-D-mannosaminyltransferase